MKKILKRHYFLSKMLFMLTLVFIASSSLAASVFVKPIVYYCTQTAANKIQFDVYVKNEGTDVLGYRSHTLRFMMNRAMLPAGAMKGGTVAYVTGTGDKRLATLQATYKNASSFIVSASILQINLGSGGTVFNQNTSPRMNPGESIWLGTFEVTAPVNWVVGAATEPTWLKKGTSISVYEAPPSNVMATICSWNYDEENMEFPAAFSDRSVAVKGNSTDGSFAARTKAFTSYQCDDNSFRAGVDSWLSMNVYPNPTSGKLSISFTAADIEKYNLCIVDLQGKELICEENTSLKGLNLHEIDLSSIAKGMYALTFQRAGMEMQTLRIVIE